MRSAMMFLLRPLAHWFLFVHVLGSPDHMSVFSAVATYSILMVMLTLAPAARYSVMITTAGSAALAIGMVHHDTTVLSYLLTAVGGAPDTA
jgi:phosphoribosylcarboxyaminoimidazole (NCAIR) mutase